AGQDADAVLFHASRGIGHHLVPIIKLYATARIRQDLRNHTFELQHLFLGHAVSLFDGPNRGGSEPGPHVALRAPARRSRRYPMGVPLRIYRPYMGRLLSAGKRKTRRLYARSAHTEVSAARALRLSTSTAAAAWPCPHVL